MEALLRALIVGNAGMIALVAPSSVVWSHLPQTTPRPAIVLYRISGAPGIHMQGSDNLLNATVQIDIQATTVASMDTGCGAALKMIKLLPIVMLAASGGQFATMLTVSTESEHPSKTAS